MKAGNNQSSKYCNTLLFLFKKLKAIVNVPLKIGTMTGISRKEKDIFKKIKAN